MRTKRVVIIGGGLAGLSCAWELVKRGVQATVLEQRVVLGGRTSSWVENGMSVETGLHKFLGIYRYLPRLLREVGVDPDEILTWTDAIEFHNRHGKSAYFMAAPYHRPFQTVRSLLGNNHYLPWIDKMKMLAMGCAGLLQTAWDPLHTDTVSVADFARRFGLSERVINDVIHTATTAVFFLPAERYSTYAAFSPLIEGIKRGMTMRVGAFNGGMSDVMIQPIASAIRAHGGDIRTNALVTGLWEQEGKIIGVKTADENLEADHVVIATSLKPAQDLIQQTLGTHPWFQPMLKLAQHSAVTLQCELDRPLFPTDHTHFSNTNVCCFAEQSHTTFKHVPGRFSAILFPPENLLNSSPDDLMELVLDETDRMEIPLRQHVTRFRVVSEPYDFYGLHPGSEALRPRQETPVPGLSLAGDYTKQPFLASMEGAVYSGVINALFIAPQA